MMSRLEPPPPPEFEGFPLDRYFTPVVVYPIYTTRSCAWNRCTFCTIASSSGTFRVRPAEQIAEELAYLQQRYGANHFTFIDETLPPRVVRKLAAAIIDRQLDIHWYGEARMVASFNANTLAQASRSGLRLLQFGLESYNQRILDLINKGIKIEEVAPLLHRCLENEIAFHLFCFIGFPSETEDEAQQTLAFTDHIIQVAAEQYGNPCCTKGIGTFGLEKDTAIAMQPERFGITLIPCDEANDLELDIAYEAGSGLTMQSANNVIAHHTGINLYREVAERTGRLFINRLLKPDPPREEESFIRWCLHEQNEVMEKQYSTAPTPAAAIELDSAIQLATLPAVHIKESNQVNGHAHYALNKCHWQIIPLADKQKAVLELIKKGDFDLAGSIETETMLTLARLYKQGIIRFASLPPWLTKKQDLDHCYLHATSDVWLLALTNERYVLLDQAKELLVELNHAGSLIWLLIQTSSPTVETLLQRMREIYGEQFSKEGLNGFLHHLMSEEMICPLPIAEQQR